MGRRGGRLAWLVPHATRENLGYLLAKASQRWNELLQEGFAPIYPRQQNEQGRVARSGGEVSFGVR